MLCLESLFKSVFLAHTNFRKTNRTDLSWKQSLES